MILPTSNFRDITSLMNIIVKLSPKKVLDIGAGSGKYGVLCKEYLGEIHPELELHAVEGYKEFVNPAYYVYSKTIIGDIRKVSIEDDYDLIMFIHILEHMSKEEGRELIKKLMERCNYLMVAVPRYFSFQHDDDDKGYQNHIHDWNTADFNGLGYIRKLKTPLSKVFIITTRNKKELNRMILIYYFKLFAFRFPFLVRLYRGVKGI